MASASNGGVSLDVNADDLIRVDRAIRRMGGYVTKTRAQLLRSVTKAVVESIRAHIRVDKRDSRGRFWPKLKGAVSFSTRKGGSGRSKRARNGSLLYRTHRLHNSVRGRSEGGWSVSAAANTKYANAQNFGYKPRNLPAREYLYLSRKNRDALVTITNAWIGKASSGG